MDDKIIVNPIGKIVDEEWRRTAMVRPNIELDAYIIMPNYVHGIIIIHDTVVGAHCYVPLQLRIREYIKYNPLKWEFDRENPDRMNP